MDSRTERRLVRLMARHGMGELVYSVPDTEITLSLDGLLPLHDEIRARQAGRFLSRHPSCLQAPAFPHAVRAGDIVGYLQIGPLLVPVLASQDGTLPAPLFDDHAIVGFGDVLF